MTWEPDWRDKLWGSDPRHVPGMGWGYRMVDTAKGEADRQVVLSKYPDAFCARNPGEPWQVIRVNPYVALSGKNDSADEAWADAASTVQAVERLQGATA